jgi:hypothetical protein
LNSKVDLSRIKIRLENISEKATKFVSFSPSDVTGKLQDFYMSPTMSSLEEPNDCYQVEPKSGTILNEWSVYAYDESMQNYRALEGDLLFCSSATIKIEDRYNFNLSVLPFFLTCMRKFKEGTNEEIRFAENLAEERNLIMVKTKIDSIQDSVESYSIVLIDGPLIGGNASAYIEAMDEALREKDCIPLYFVKNSDSRLVIDSNKNLAKEFNSDFHWAACRLKTGSRSAFFKYTDRVNNRHTKVFTYMKALYGFPERVEMHTATYEKYHSIIPDLMSLIAYFYILQGDMSNPQVRPIAIAEKYAREGIRILNIPTLLARLGFRPTINQVRFG